MSEGEYERVAEMEIKQLEGGFHHSCSPGRILLSPVDLAQLC